MKKSSSINGSFSTLLIKNYIVFTITIVLLIIIAFALGMKLALIALKIPTGEVLQQAELLSSENYSELNITQLVGRDGYIEILDSNRMIIFSSVEGASTTVYTQGELDCIPNYSNNENIVAQEYNDENGAKRILITKTISTPNFETIPKAIGFQVLDEKLNILYSNLSTSKSSYTQKEYSYLTSLLPQNYIARKYPFSTESGKQNTLLLMVPKDVNALSNLRKTAEFTLFIFLLFYTISIILFIYWLYRKVKKPLDALNYAMISFADGNRQEEISYAGPVEFVQICESFNKMSRRLNESQRAQNALAEQKQKMLADISHDLKTPITSIQGYAKILSDGLVPIEQQDKYLKIIYRKANHLTHLINTFYEYSKLEHTKFEYVLEKVDFAEFLREYLAEKYEDIEVAEFNLEVEIPEKVIFCSIDKLQMKRALDNIIDNALKHNPSGTNLYVFLQEKRETIRIILADNGVGIPETIAETIFEPFVVGDDSRKSEQGSGLGLSISQKIVLGHGGNIRLVSLLPDGYKTKFEILVPKYRY
ncbi:MAG: ATP-binding protein [Cellulosilyticaceae bacterium]